MRELLRRPGAIGWIGGAAVLVLVAVTISAFASDGPAAPQADAAHKKLPDIVVIVADDQRFDTVAYMPIVREKLARHGVTFTNAVVTNALCCPSRASILTGTYSHTNGVYDNRGPRGGFDDFFDTRTIATAVDLDYDVGLFGKYLNKYQPASRSGYIPFGWDRWVALDRLAFTDFVLNVDGTTVRYDRPQDYSTTVLAEHAVEFIEESEGPVMVYYAPPAPHFPAIPAVQDRDAFPNLPDWRPPSYNEPDLSDKPQWLQRMQPLNHYQQRRMDEFRRLQLQSLQALDRATGDIVDALERTGRLDNALIVYMSDNGYLWGEHRLKGKEVAYEESIRVPMVVRYDPLVDRARTDDALVANIDIAPTIVDLAKGRMARMDGRSLAPLLRSPGAPWRDAILIEHWAPSDKVRTPTYCAVRTDRYKLVDYLYGGDTDELYDLQRDPRELQNAINDPSLRGIRQQLSRRLNTLCKPPPPRPGVPIGLRG